MSANWQSGIKYLGGSIDEENRFVQKMARQVHDQIEELSRNYNIGLRLRPQHAKMIVGVKNATINIASNISEDLQVGFIKPRLTYPVLIRFSNASAFVQNDTDDDLRGVAVKINFPGNSEQDFLMTNAEQHHAKNALHAMAISLASTKKNKLQVLFDLVKRVGIVDAIKMIKTVKAQMKRPVTSLTTETYWSRAPLRIGDVVVKYRLLAHSKENENEKISCRLRPQ